VIKHKKGKPTSIITVRLPEAWVRGLDRIAKRERMTRSDIIRYMIKIGFKLDKRNRLFLI